MTTNYLRIATEEAFATRELIELYRKFLQTHANDDPGFASLMGFYLKNPSPASKAVAERLEDLGERRIRDMDATGIAKQILSVTSPGVQIFDRETAVPLAVSCNDQLADAI